MSYEHAQAAASMATQDVILALISALAESGALTDEALKRHVQKVQDIQQGNTKLNQDIYDKTIHNFIAASEGRVR
jgi:hypothetical protein